MDKMEYWSFLWRFLCLSFSNPWAIASGVAFVFTLLAGSFALLKKPKWSNRMNKWAYILPAALFFIILIFSFIFTAPYNIYEEQWEKINSYYAGVEQDVAKLEEDITLLERKILIALPKITSLEQTSINDVVVDTTELSGSYNSKVFQNCYFTGMGYIHFSNSDFSNCSYRDTTNPFMAVSELPENVISFNNCIFEDCIFWGITFIGDDSEMEQLKSLILEE